MLLHWLACCCCTSQDSYYSVTMERGYLVLHGRQGNQLLKSQSTGKGSLSVRWYLWLKYIVHQECLVSSSICKVLENFHLTITFVLISKHIRICKLPFAIPFGYQWPLRKAPHPSFPGHSVCYCRGWHIWSVHWRKANLNKFQEREFQELLHWGPTN